MESSGSNPQAGANSVNPSDSCSFSRSQVILTDPHLNSSAGNSPIGEPFVPRQSDVSFTPGYNTSPAHYIIGSCDPHAVPYASEQRNPPANAGHYIVGDSDPHAIPYASEQQYPPSNAGHHIVGGSDPHSPASAGNYIVGSSDPHAIPYASEQRHSPANTGPYVIGGSDPHAVPYASGQQNPPANAGPCIVGDFDPHAIPYASEQQYPPSNAGHHIVGGSDTHSPASAGHYIVGSSDPDTIPYASEQQHPRASAGHCVVGSSDLYAIDDSTGLLDPHGSSPSPCTSSRRAIAVRMPSWTPNDASAHGVTARNLIPFLSCGGGEALPIALSDILLHNFHKFLESILERSNTESDPLFAIMETFIVDYGGESKVMGCLAVTTANDDNILCHDYVLSSVSQSKTEPTSWLTTQSLGSLFKSERQKRGVWALTQLPDGHLKSLTQQWTLLKLK